MKLHRFYTNIDIEEGKINSLPDHSLIHQIENVLRLKQGDKIVLFNGSGRDFESEIISLNKNEMTFRVVNTKIVKPHSSLKLSLAFSLIKKDNTEWIIQKCTELGVTEFIPVVSERSEKKGFNLERAKKIMIEACEQSGRGDIPEIFEPRLLTEFLENEKRKIVSFHTEGENFRREDFTDQIKSANLEIVACIGPEGGWSEKEVSLFKKIGTSIVSLDMPILRAETAAVAISTLFLF
jgi:16S rRNA (uracil1498-N3)-methyltransferase